MGCTMTCLKFRTMRLYEKRWGTESSRSLTRACHKVYGTLQKIVFRSAVILLSATLLSGCGPALKDVPVISIPITKKEGFEHTIIGICAAGLSDEVQAAVRAEYSRREFAVGFRYEEVVRGAIFDDENIEGSDRTKMYETYIACVSRSSDAQQCRGIRESCEREFGRVYKDCLEEARNRCISECVWEYGNSRNECVTEFCDPGPRNIAHWTKKRCEYSRDMFYECERDFRLCLLDQ